MTVNAWGAVNTWLSSGGQVSENASIGDSVTAVRLVSVVQSEGLAISDSQLSVKLSNGLILEQADIGETILTSAAISAINSEDFSLTDTVSDSSAVVVEASISEGFTITDTVREAGAIPLFASSARIVLMK